MYSDTPHFVVPQILQEIASASSEDEQIATVGVTPETFLHLQRKRVHPPAHVRRPRGQPHPNRAGDRNHRPATTATTASTRASAGACTVASTMTCTSSPSTISMRPDAASLAGSGASTTTGTNPAPVSAAVR